MNHLFRFMHSTRRSRQASHLVALVACLLVSIRLVAGFICSTCFLDFEKPGTRTVYLHGGGDADPCHHGHPEASPLISWACAASKDVPAFILPEIPRLPVVVSVFVPLALLLVSYRNTFLIAAHGRGPPARVS